MNTHDEIVSRARLLLNIQMPDLEECWQEGYESQIRDVDETSNPYAEHSTEYYHWSEGWWAACYGEAPIYNLASDQSMMVQEAANEAEMPIATPQQVDALSFKQLAKRAAVFGSAILLTILCFELADMVA